MKAIRHQIAHAKREMAVLLLMLAAPAAALVMGIAMAQSPPVTESSPAHRCEGLPSITMTVSALTLAAGNDLTEQATAPSGDCTLTVTLYASAHTLADPQLESDETCTVTVTASPRNDGTAVEVQRRGICGTLPVETRIDLSPESARPTEATGASSYPVSAISRIWVWGLPPTGVWAESYVRGVWDYHPDNVLLREVTYPSASSTHHLLIESEDRRVRESYAPNDVHVTVSNRMQWRYLVDDRFTTIATLTIRPDGAFSCGHWFSGMRINPRGDEIGAFIGECLP